MKLSTILTASTLLGAFVYAAPLSALDPRVFQVGVKFFGADEGSYFDQTFPADGTLLKITNPLSVSHIEFAGGAICFFTGVDGSETVLLYQQIREADVSPPQAQLYGYCVN